LTTGVARVAHAETAETSAELEKERKLEQEFTDPTSKAGGTTMMIFVVSSISALLLLGVAPTPWWARRYYQERCTKRDVTPSKVVFGDLKQINSLRRPASSGSSIKTTGAAMVGR
jgi:hypothetical protein